MQPVAQVRRSSARAVSCQAELPFTRNEWGAQCIGWDAVTLKTLSQQYQPVEPATVVTVESAEQVVDG